ncbi:MAG TPA: hypothetical protein VN845_09955, partial [Solirubrobacteraceae bacterium]|nr:hypothetical protein [Solirubrobacteraceae bacterium]
HLYAVDWDKRERRETITVNDGAGPRTVLLGSDFSQGAWTSFPVTVSAGGSVMITVARTGGWNAVLNGVFLGGTGAPPANSGQELSQGGWVGGVGSAGYVLGGWDGTVGDLAYLPNASMTLLQGSRYRWVANTTEGSALQDPGEHTRNAAAFYGTNQIAIQLNFTAAYSGNLHLYAVDWDKRERRETITVNGQTAVLSSNFSEGAWVSFPISVAAGGTATITVDRTAGLNAVLSGIFLGDAGAPPTPPVSTAPQGGWVGLYGSAGYLLPDWDGVQDLSDMPGVATTLVQGSRYKWAGSTTEARALEDPSGLTRSSAVYDDPNEIRVQLTFTSAYSGNLHLYAVDWDKRERRETITVDGQTANLSSNFSEGAWVSFPVSVAAGGTVTVIVDRTAGLNAVLSGIFLGDAGAPPSPSVSSAPQGSWVGQVGSAGYLLPDWDGVQDLSNMPGVTPTVVEGSRYKWAGSTTEARALEDPSGLLRSSAVYCGQNQVEVQLKFASAYSGNLHLYAVDWDKRERRETITVNGQTAMLASEFNEGAWVSFPINVAAGGTVTITVDRTAGFNAVLSGIFLGDTGAPPAMPVTQVPQGNWVGTYGSSGYALADWSGSSDLSSLTDASLTLEQGSRYRWNASTTSSLALENPEKSARVAATYYDPNQVKLKLSFTTAFSGNLEMYAIDWDKKARRETITVNGQTAVLANEFSEGAWVSFPINVSAGESVTITADRTAGNTAVISGIFLN